MHVISQRLSLFSVLQEVWALEAPELDVPPVLVELEIVEELWELTDAPLEDVWDPGEFATFLTLSDWLETTVVLVCA